MRSYRAALVIISAGLLTFGLVFTLLQVSRLAAAPGEALIPATDQARAEADTLARSADSLEPRLAAGRSAVGVPIAGSEPLLRDVQTGDRLDVLASLASPGDGRPVTAVVVRGATVLRPPTSSDPLLLEVKSIDALVLAHLVLGGTRLGYTVWPANGEGPPEAQPIDERTARAMLGLSTSTEQAPAVAEARPTAAGTAAPAGLESPTPAPALPRPGAVSAFIYQAQPGDAWETVAATFNLTAAELRQWNEAAPDATLAPGSLLVIPRKGSG